VSVTGEGWKRDGARALRLKQENHGRLLRPVKAARPRRSDVSEEFRADVVRVHPPQVRSDPELMMVPVYQKDPERTR